jgi:hypothetical protein
MKKHEDKFGTAPEFFFIRTSSLFPHSLAAPKLREGGSFVIRHSDHATRNQS